MASFYRFTAIADPAALCDELAAHGRAAQLRGTVLVAHEGLNATVAGSAAAVATMLARIERLPGCADLRVTRAHVARNPFRRLKVRVRSEIVTLGQPGIAPHRRTGTHVAPRAWDALLAEPRMVVLDTRNDYEHRIGSFAGAVTPPIGHFREFPRFVAAQFGDARPPVAMFCTGGIRCEKASAYLLAQGFGEVYQLDGGILRYLAETPVYTSRWRGACFVFDERVAVDHALRPADYEQCPGCRQPVAAAERAMPGYEAGISCPACHATLSTAQRRGFAERRRQVALAGARDAAHLGAVMPR
ncbi:MAG: rhodanese-related sulfurtransferase [Gammaproteobacteria bacterium]